MKSDSKSKQLTVIYDGDCSVCTRIVNSFKKWDRDGVLELLRSQSPGVRVRFPAIPAANYAESLQVVASDGRIFQGARAVEVILNVLPRGKLFAWLMKIPLVRPLAERFYRWFARNRYRLGCSEHCSLSSKQKR